MEVLTRLDKGVKTGCLLAFFMIVCSHPFLAQRNGSQPIAMDSSAVLLEQAQTSQDIHTKLILLNRALEWSIRSHNANNEVAITFALGRAYEQSMQVRKAEKQYQKCIQLAEKLTTPNESSYSTQLESHIQLIQLELANGRSQKAVQMAEAVPASLLERNVPLLKNAFNRLTARSYLMNKQTDQALSKLQAQMDWEVQNDDYFGMIETKLLQGDVLQSMSRHKEAEAHYLSALEYAKGLQSEEHIIRCNQKLATTYRLQSNLDSELFYRNSNIAFNQGNSNTMGIMQEKAEIANAYIQSDRLVEATQMVQSNEVYMNDAIAQNTTSPQQDMSAMQFKAEVMQENATSYKLLAEAYNDQQDYKQALLHYKKYVAYQDSVNRIRQLQLEFSLKINDNLTQNEQRIELLEKDREISEQNIELLRQENAISDQQVFHRNLVIGGLACCVLALAIGGFYFIRLTRSRQKADKLVALQSLTGQMNPHFIFNALNSVNEYIGNNDERSANRYLTSFSKLMRQVMDDSRKSFIPFQEELEMLQLYLQLEHARFEDRFNFKVELDPAFDCTLYDIPPMLIQPYIENAIWHGLRYRKEKGELSIQISGDATQLRIAIVDNGIGMEQSKALKTPNQKKQKSLAMRNTETRIRLIDEVYHYPIRLHISNAFENREYPGTRVVLTLPMNSKTDVQ
jgi:hypothetical protein